MSKEYDSYQDKLKAVEQEENDSGDGAEQHVPAAFLLVGAFVSAGATYYLNEAGMRNSPLYAKTIGADNAAFLVTLLLEGSFLALTLFGYKFLKSESQREAGAFAVFLLKIILSLNLIVAFIMLAGYGLKIMPAVQFYAQWGTPATVVGVIWLWAHIVSNRRKTIIRNQMLDDQAKVERMWAEQYRKDQARYRVTYQMISGAPEMQAMREQIAAKQAIAQIAKESGLTLDEAEQIYLEVHDRGRLGPGRSGHEPKRLGFPTGSSKDPKA